MIICATFTGPGIGEGPRAATIAIVGAVPIEPIRHAVPAFPSLAEVWLELILACQAHR